MLMVPRCPQATRVTLMQSAINAAIKEYGRKSSPCKYLRFQNSYVVIWLRAPVVMTECMSERSVECDSKCACMRLDEWTVRRMTGCVVQVPCQHRLESQVILRWPGYIYIYQHYLHQDQSVCERKRENTRERKLKYGDMNKQLYNPPTQRWLSALTWLDE